MGLYFCEQGCQLPLRCFVATQVLLGFREPDVLTQPFAVLAEAQLVRGIHGVFARIINTFARLFADQTNNFALIAFLSHNLTFLCNQSE